MKFLTILGARPQFIKASVVSDAIRDFSKKLDIELEEIILHTGQHFDVDMSENFFRDLKIPTPKYNLGISSLSHGAMTGKMIEAIEKILLRESPDCLIVFGDTNSTLAAALSACKLHIPIAHVEAGLRSNNLLMPEEINRILTDRISTFLFCPSKTAEANLLNEGYPLPIYLRDQSIHNFGDVMFDVLRKYKVEAQEKNPISQWGLEEDGYILATIHRPHLTDSLQNLTNVLSALTKISKEKKLVIPLHPRTKKKLKDFNLINLLDDFLILEPLTYLEMQSLLSKCNAVITDSGGLQKEAFWHRKPCITLREDTEWLETVQSGWNTLAGCSEDLITKSWKHLLFPTVEQESFYGRGDAAHLIVSKLIETFKEN